MHCNLRPPETRQPFAALITTPCQVWCRRTYPLPYYSGFAADTLLYDVILIFDPVTSGVCGPSFTKLGEDIGRSSQHCTFVSEFGYLAAFSNACGSKLRDVLNDAKFRTFWPPVKLGEGWPRSLYQLLKLYLRSNLRNTFDGHPLHCCWARWIDKKERKRKFIGKTEGLPY